MEDFEVLRGRVDALEGMCGNLLGMNKLQQLQIAELTLAYKRLSAVVLAQPGALLSVEDFNECSQDGEWMVAIADFVSDNQEELAFTCGARLKVVNRPYDDWVEVKQHGISGLVPTTYLHPEQPMQGSSATARGEEHGAEAEPSRKVPPPVPEKPLKFRQRVGAVEQAPAAVEQAPAAVEPTSVLVPPAFLPGDDIGILPGEFVPEPEDIIFKVEEEEALGTPMRALGDYSAQTENEISFSKGAILNVVARPYPGWVEVQSHGVEGLVPSSMLENIGTDRSTHNTGTDGSAHHNNPDGSAHHNDPDPDDIVGWLKQKQSSAAAPLHKPVSPPEHTTAPLGEPSATLPAALPPMAANFTIRPALEHGD